MRSPVRTHNCRRITAAVIAALAEARGVDYVSVWWTARTASRLSRSDLRLALDEALDLACTLGLLDPPAGTVAAVACAPARRAPPDPGAALN